MNEWGGGLTLSLRINLLLARAAISHSVPSEWVLTLGWGWGWEQHEEHGRGLPKEKRRKGMNLYAKNIHSNWERKEKKRKKIYEEIGILPDIPPRTRSKKNPTREGGKKRRKKGKK